MRKQWNSGRTPKGDQPIATIAILVLLGASLIGTWAFSGADYNPVNANLRYSPDLSRPWTLLTYPFGIDLTYVIWFVVACWCFYQFSSGLERLLGAWGNAAFFVVMTLCGGLGYFGGSIVAGGPSMILPSFNLILEVVVFTWCVVHPTAKIMLFAIIPIPTTVLKWICVAGIVIENGWGNPLVGVFTAFPILVAWAYATNRLPGLRFGLVPSPQEVQTKKKDDREFARFMDDVKAREKERAEKERLRKLFESSLDDDKKD
jgi:hypothetical protein